jgi:FAD/FMN-containing dehydrogenase
MATVQEDVVAGLEGFSGQLLRPEDVGYEEARRIHNGLVDKRPALIGRCLGTADVVAAIDLAREHGLEVSVRGGGHNVAGKAVTDGGVMIDLALMKGMHVDPKARTIRAQGGLTWGELNRETQLHGLAVTGGVVSTTGIAGLTLGGGLGYMMGKFGLSTDNLISAEVVTADGRVLTASDDENADLFWAIRGGGGNFGVVTSFLYRLHPVGPIVTGGLVIHPFEAARDFLRFMREYTDGISDDQTLFAGLVHAPDGSGAPLCAAVLCHIGEPEAAQKELEPLLTFGSPLDVPVSQMPYTVVNTLIDDGFPKGALNYWKATFLRELSDDAIDTMIEAFAACPSPMTALIFEHFHGEVTRIPVDAMAVPHRQPGLNLVIPSIWADPATTDANIAWTRETFAAMQPFAAGRQYVNYQGADESSQDAVRIAYGPNYDRLVEVKSKYDPGNRFRLNQNIEPRAA